MRPSVRDVDCGAIRASPRSVWRPERMQRSQGCPRTLARRPVSHLRGTFRAMTRLLALGSTVLALALLACSDPTLAPAQAGAPPSAAVVGAAPPSGAPESPSADPAPAISREETADVRVVPPAESGAVARGAAPVAPAPAPSAATLLREAAALEPGGPVPLTHESEPVVDPAAT